MTWLHKVTEANFEAEVMASPIPVLVDFSRPDCPPCRYLLPVLDELVGELAGRIKVVTVDVERDAELAQRFGIQVVPTLIAFDRGRQAARLAVLQNRRRLLEAVEELTPGGGRPGLER